MSNRRFSIAYELIYDLPEQADPYDNGFSERGISMEPTQKDLEAGKDAVDLAVAFLIKRDAIEYNYGEAYTTEPRFVEEGTEIGRGLIVEADSYLRYFYFPKGFTPEEEDAIYERYIVQGPIWRR